MMSEMFDEELQRKDYDNASREEARKEGTLSTLSVLVNNGKLSIADAAITAHMSVEEFQKASANLTP